MEGIVISILGQIVEVEFVGEIKPRIHDVLCLEDDKNVKMEVYTSAANNSFYCLLLSSSPKLHRGKKVIDTKSPLRYR